MICSTCNQPLYLVRHHDTEIAVLSHLGPSASEATTEVVTEVMVNDEEERCRARYQRLHTNPCRVLGTH